MINPHALALREIEDRDLGVLFEHSRDPDAIRMAAFTPPDADDRTNFERRWARLRSDRSTTNRVVEIDGRVVGHIASFDLEGHREVTYWIGRQDWGRGIATRALQEFLQLEATRPLYAHAASDNAASIRVLTKCGFLIVGAGREFAHGRNEETDEVVLRLDANSSALSVTAADGRKLMVAQWGDMEGFPVFSLHGTPGSRLGRHYDQGAYIEVGARVITYDRPGYGGSERHRGRRVVDCVSDVADIADALEVGRFAVTGGSGGGPHSLALAARLPARVTRATCDVGVVPWETPDFDWFEGMDPLNVREFEWALRGEEVLAHEYEREAAEMLERVAADPSTVLGEEWQLSEADRAQLANSERHKVVRQMISEAFRNGVWGIVDDMLCITKPWGFDVAEIGVPTRIMYGLTDVLVPRQHGEWLAGNVPNATAVIDEEAGHVADSARVTGHYRWLVEPT